MYRFKQYRSTMGFTLIELMITIAIVAILVTLAVPAYNDYSIRAKVAECINGAAIGKVSISEYRQTLGAWPPSLEEAGLAIAGISHYCTALNNYQSSSGAFTIDINEAVIETGLGVIAPVMTPTSEVSNVINWDCSRGITPAENMRYLPSTCRGS